jgi:leucyl/phenylalanyl-tRNA--protein transferase
MPVEPPPTRWSFPPAQHWPPAEDLVCGGADLEPGTLLAAYRAGIFPMPLHGMREMAWWSPDPRGILPVDRLRVTRTLRRSLRRYEVRTDTAFDDVVAACADRRRPGGWIDGRIRRAYRRLHELGWAHSVEAWTPDGELAGGLYGVAVGGLFAGESMFHRRTDASKVALVALVSMMRADGVSGRLLDVQWRTDHLARLGAVELARPRYLRCLERALEHPLPRALTAGSDTPESG